MFLDAVVMLFCSQQTEVNLRFLYHVDTIVEEVEVGAFLAVQVVIVTVTGTVAGARVQRAVRVQ